MSDEHWTIAGHVAALEEAVFALRESLLNEQRRDFDDLWKAAREQATAIAAANTDAMVVPTLLTACVVRHHHIRRVRERLDSRQSTGHQQ